MISLSDRETKQTASQPRRRCCLRWNQPAAISLAFLCLATVLACRFSSEGASATSGGPLATSSLASGRTPSPPKTPASATSFAILPSERGLIDVPIEYEFLTPFENLPHGEGLVIWDFKAQRFDYLTWDGQRFPLLSVTLSPGLTDFVRPAPVFGEADKIVLPIAGDFYVFDLKSRSAWGYATDCEDLYVYVSPPENWAVGQRYVAFLCRNDVHIVSLAQPSAPFTKLIVGGEGSVVPTWSGDSELTIRSKPAETIARRWCTATLPSPSLECQEPPYWVGAISPDGASMEVREVGVESPLPWEPDRVGVASAECLMRGEQECRPRWYPGDGVVAAWDDHSWTGDYLGHRLPVAWSPDGASMLFITQQEAPNRATAVASVGHDVWRLNLKTGSFARLRTISSGFPMFRWLERDGQYLPPIWAPGGERVLIEPDTFYRTQDRYPLFLLSIRDGSLTTLTEQGGPVLGPLSVP